MRRFIPYFRSQVILPILYILLQGLCRPRESTREPAAGLEIQVPSRDFQSYIFRIRP